MSQCGIIDANKCPDLRFLASLANTPFYFCEIGGCVKMTGRHQRGCEASYFYRCRQRRGTVLIRCSSGQHPKPLNMPKTCPSNCIQLVVGFIPMFSVFLPWSSRGVEAGKVQYYQRSLSVEEALRGHVAGASAGMDDKW